jgi:hypothetical protein
MIDHVRDIADVAWESMRAHGIIATPRNYEVWFTFCSSDKPLLNRRLDTILWSGQALTPGLLDQLYQEFFATHFDVGVVRDGSHELQQIASEVVYSVLTDRVLIGALGKSLGDWSATIRRVPTSEELQLAAATLGGASAQASGPGNGRSLAPDAGYRSLQAFQLHLRPCARR